jgi:hypothetical protein
VDDRSVTPLDPDFGLAWTVREKTFMVAEVGTSAANFGASERRFA